MTINNCIISDLEIIAKWENNFKDGSGFTIEQIRKMFNDKNYCFVGVYEVKLIGYCIFNISDNIDILKIYIDKNKRNNNFGTQIINYLKFTYKKNIIVEVNKNNDAAIIFYKKNGFKLISERKNYYKNGDSALILLLKC